MRQQLVSGGLPGWVGAVSAVAPLVKIVRRVSPLALPVLVRGESGSGKELVAAALHAWSERRGTFVTLNAATLGSALAGSALFGHERGAFTDASQARKGAFREADGGTLFLDEVGSLPPSVQASLLRVLETGAVRPVGSDRTYSVDVRVVAATCEDLEAASLRGDFRHDLFQRLSACLVRVPPLRERQSDIPRLADHLLERAGLAGLRLELGAYRQLRAYRWPGNVRELRNVLVQAALTAEGSRVTADDVRGVLRDRGVAPPEDGQRRPLKRGRPLSRDRALAYLSEAEGNISGAARLAGLPRSTFRDALNRMSVSAQTHLSPLDLAEGAR
ncbi:MAG: sigma 54-interacting transcriptional regulator [Myxococcota bacterium]